MQYAFDTYWVASLAWILLLKIAVETGMFWIFHALLYQNQSEEQTRNQTLHACGYIKKNAD
jgi:hypothetical protein